MISDAVEHGVEGARREREAGGDLGVGDEAEVARAGADEEVPELCPRTAAVAACSLIQLDEVLEVLR